MKTLEQIQDLITGVELKSLVTHGDQRGFFREIIRHSDPFFQGGFAQWSHSKMARNTVKAWHYHHLQTDWWYVGIGLVHVVLIDNRNESITKGKKIEFLLSEEQSENALQLAVKIPPGVLHGCKVLSEVAHLFYITSHVYDPHDEGRLPFNSLEHDWGDAAELIVVENDKRAFIPKYERALLNK